LQAPLHSVSIKLIPGIFVDELAAQPALSFHDATDASQVLRLVPMDP
jgi:hypothetical protein